MPLGVLLFYLHLSDFVHICVREIGTDKSKGFNYIGGGFQASIIDRFKDRIVVKSEITDNILYIYVTTR